MATAKTYTVEGLYYDELFLIDEAIDLYVASKRRVQNSSKDLEVKEIAARRIAAALQLRNKFPKPSVTA